MKKLIVFLCLIGVGCSRTKTPEAPPAQIIQEVGPATTFDFLSSRPIHELIIGWESMLSDINAHLGQKMSLKGKKYELRLKLKGQWLLEILPSRAFQVRRLEEGKFLAQILSPSLLFEDIGGLEKMAYIAARLSRVGGHEGKLAISGNLECLYPFSFYQQNGEIVNFEKIQHSYLVDFIISHPEALYLQNLSRFSAIFKRPIGNAQDVTVSLKLTHKQSGEIYQGEQLAVPACAPYMGMQKDARFQPRLASQCLHHLKSEGEAYNSQKNRLVKTSESFTNSCDRDIKCSLPARYAYLQRGKIAYVENKNYPFTVAPRKITQVDTSWNFNSYMGRYSETLYTAARVGKDIVDFLPKSKDSLFIDCQWSL